MVIYGIKQKKKGRITMKWNEMTSMQKIGFVVLCIGAVLMIAAVLKPALFPANMTTYAIAIMSVGEAMDYWQKNRKWAYLFIAAAVISAGCALLELFL